MQLSKISAVAAALGQASLAFGAAIDSQSMDLMEQWANATADSDALTNLFDSISWLSDEEVAAGSIGSFGDKVPGQNPLTLCEGSHGNDAVSVAHVNLDPQEPVRGQQLSIQGAGQISRPITDGAKVKVKVKMNRLQVYDKQFDLCKELAKIGLKTL